MIKSDIVKFKKVEGFDNQYIEQELAKMYKSVVRWAVVKIDTEIEISVSYEV